MLTKTKDGCTLKVKITPNSSKNEIITTQDIVKIKLTASPVDGKANKALIEFLSKHLKIPKTSISIIKGETSKEKILLFPLNSFDKLKELL